MLNEAGTEDAVRILMEERPWLTDRQAFDLLLRDDRRDDGSLRVNHRCGAGDGYLLLRTSDSQGERQIDTCPEREDHLFERLRRKP